MRKKRENWKEFLIGVCIFLRAVHSIEEASKEFEVSERTIRKYLKWAESASPQHYLQACIGLELYARRQMKNDRI